MRGQAPRVCGDRPHESLIFQHVPHIGPAATPNSGLIACFSPVGDACPEFIFNSFFFSEDVLLCTCRRGKAAAERTTTNGKNGKNQEV